MRARQLRPNPSPLPAGEPRRAVHGPAAEDALTGLANRALFLDRLSAVTASGAPLAVLFLDLDDFKLVNDGWGHETGDQLLREVADRLRAAVRPGDLVARLGGDEFTVLCEGVAGEREALAIAGRLRVALEEPFDIAGQRRHVRASIGCRVVSESSAGAATASSPARACCSRRCRERSSPARARSSGRRRATLAS